jgi:uncharacterized protein YaaN involved in tellurite resistance
MPDEITIPQLTLTTDFDELDVVTEKDENGEPVKTEIIILEKKDPVIKAEELEKLTDEEKKMVEEFSKQIDLTDNKQVLLYGAAAQKHIADFSDTALQSVRTKDTGAACLAGARNLSTGCAPITAKSRQTWTA